VFLPLQWLVLVKVCHAFHGVCDINFKN
jgi:hypothetical protein